MEFDLNYLAESGIATVPLDSGLYFTIASCLPGLGSNLPIIALMRHTRRSWSCQTEHDSCVKAAICIELSINAILALDQPGKDNPL